MKVKDLTVKDVINMPEFKEGMEACIKEIQRKRKYARNVFGPIKRGPIDTLEEKGLFNAEAMVVLYNCVLAKSLDKTIYSSSVRNAIEQIGDTVIHRTVEYLKQMEGVE